MSSSPQEIALMLVEDGFELNDGDESLSEIRQQIKATEARISDLERDLTGVTKQEAEMARQLETRRTRRTALDRQLGEERKEEARLRLEESIAAQTAVLVDAENEASQITKQARQEADEILADSRRESAAIVEAGRERLAVLEEDAARLAVELDAEHHARSEELRIMETLYDELQSTLKLVAETSIKRLVDTQSSLAQLDPTEREHQRPAVSDIEGE
jgi:DNA repair exonuclease SbcCD ATPase subunit